ncbi:hypothetical protein GIB67_001865 [Kingdonia uniflora]|uniref:Protein kinase domain-containing protein n=1 Tax=Kingdonia uniflora TaxID=39325 RepID=A0A7J7LQR5_9MAGN|nr:hypothetical protein GIB67_001865 [Kingdonia uniflora]
MFSFEWHQKIIMNEDLEELKELGSGTFGSVYHGKWRGTDIAIKRIKKICCTDRSSDQERLEVDILLKFYHPNVVAFYGVVQDGPGATMAIVTEFMVNGSLRHVLLRWDRVLPTLGSKSCKSDLWTYEPLFFLLYLLHICSFSIWNNCIWIF